MPVSLTRSGSRRPLPADATRSRTIPLRRPSPVPSPARYAGRPRQALRAASILAIAIRAAVPDVAHAGTLPPVIVESSRSDREAGEVSAPISVKTAAELERAQTRDLAGVLQGMPGVGVSGGPRTTAIQPVIRGLGGERVVIRVDGARQNFSSGHRGRVFLDPFLLEQVEVLRGPASVLYGSGALGGVVSLRTLDAERFLRPDQSVGGRVTAAAHANGDLRLGALSAAMKSESGHGGLLLSGLLRDSGDLDSGNDRPIPFTGDDIRSGLIHAYLRPAAGHRLSLGGRQFRDDHTLPSAANTDISSNVVARRTDSTTVTARYQWQSPGNPLIDLDATVYRAAVALDERRLSDGRDDDTDLTTLGLDLANTSVFESGTLQHRLVAGTELYRDRQRGARNGAPRPQFPDARQSVAGVFLIDHIGLGRQFELAPGLRYDRFRRSSAAQGASGENALSRQFTATWHAGDSLDLYAAYAEAFRVPSLTDLFVGGEHFPGNVFVPNPDLRPEQARNREIGLRWQERALWASDDQLRVHLGGFRNDVSDFIEQRVVFDSFFPVPTGRTFSENVLEARLRGHEIEAEYRRPSFYAKTAYTRLRGENRADGSALGGIPADALILEGGRYFDGGDWLLGARVVRVSDQNRVADGETATPGYTVWNLFATWQPAAFGQRLRVDLGVENLTDRQYRPHLSALPDAGRNLKLQTSYRF